VHCETCGHDNAEGNRFCGGCGAALGAAPAAPTSVQLPVVLGAGRYRTQRLLGEGSRKRVYLALDERLAREVAVSVVKTGGLDAAGHLRITREAQAMARLGDHPNIVTVFDVGEEADGTPFIVSQYMSGGSLAEHLESMPGRRLDLDRALTLTEQLASALAHAHQLGIVHRDVKPANVWLDSDGSGRLGDFGLAADVDASRITSEGTVLGTLAYLAPEQALGREPDPRSDLYSLGALLYELLCGRPPFLGDDAVSVISQHLNNSPVSPRFHNPDVPDRLDKLVLKLLEKDPNARPGSGADALALLRDARAGIAAVGSVGEPVVEIRGPAAVADWGRFVGRTSELDALRVACDEALTGHTRIAMVVGEPGIGKTRTVEELGVYAAMRGTHVLWGHSYEGEIGVPYLPFVEALRAFVREISDDGHLLDPAAGCAEVAAIVPELRDRFPQLPQLPPLEGDAERHRLFEGVHAFLTAATRIRPLMIVLDDLHWADKPTLLLLTHLARRHGQSRLLIVGTYRDVELERSHPLAETIATLRRERLYERVLLRGLPIEEVKAFIEAVGGQETPGEFAELIFRETEGNPFFVAEILRHLVETGAIRHEGDSWVGTPESVAENLPEGVREVIGRRLDGLSETCNKALAIAASMPGGFTVDVVGDVADLDEDTMLDVLDEALAAQVVRERRERPGTYEFNHALIRQTLYGELSTPRRVRMHRRIGDALEVRFADAIDAHLSELAYHAYEAAPGGDVDKAVDYARRAAEAAAKQAAYEEAARSYEMAVQALELGTHDDADRRADLLLALAHVRANAGDGDGSHMAALEAADLARQLDDAVLLGRAAVEYTGGYWFSATAPDATRRTLLEEAERALRDAAPGNESLLAAVLSRHSAAVAWSDTTLAIELAAEAIDRATIADDPEALAYALMTSTIGARTLEERTAVERQVLAAAERSGAHDLLQQTRMGLMTTAIFTQHRDDFDTQVDAYEAGAKRSRVSTELVNSLHFRGSRAAIDADYHEAERLILESAEVARSAGVGAQLANVGVALAPTYRELGRLEAFERPTRRIVADAPDLPAWSAGLAQTLCEIGKVDEAVAIVERIVGQGYEAIPDNVLRRYTVCMLAEVAAAVGRSDLLAELDQWLRADLHYPVDGVILGPQAYHGSFARYLGLVAHGLGEHDDAVSLHDRALADHEAMRAAGWAARSRYDLALALLGRRSNGDAERAAALLTDVVETANARGMTRLLEQTIAARLELQGVPIDTPITASIDLVSASVTVQRPDLERHAGDDGHITICFSDIVGYTEMTDRLGDQRTHDLLRVHTEILRTELIVHHGVEVKSEGDGFMLAFGEPADALAFAAAFQRGLLAHQWPGDVGELRVRIGVHCGEVIRDADDFFGRTVIVGARVAASAGAGEVLVTDDVRRVAAERYSFGPVRELALKGLSATYPAFPLEWSSVR
jgi:eukaryotic-like serine/threonine-protein kinase